VGSSVGRGSGRANAYSQGVSLSLTQRVQCERLAEPPVFRVPRPTNIRYSFPLVLDRFLIYVSP
jgi:hypothetical protein